MGGGPSLGRFRRFTENAVGRHLEHESASRGHGRVLRSRELQARPQIGGGGSAAGKCTLQSEDPEGHATKYEIPGISYSAMGSLGDKSGRKTFPAGFLTDLWKVGMENCK